MDRIRTGVVIGIAMATVYSLWVTAVFLISGDAPFRDVGATYVDVIATYYGTGAFAGGVVGILSPLVNSRVGALLVGWVAAFFVFVGIAMNYHGFVTRWRPGDWMDCVVLGLLFGIVGARVFWKPERRGR